MKFIDEKIREISKGGFVLDVGGGERFQKWLNPYKHFFSNSNYKTFDYDESTGADIVGDIHSIPIEDNSVDGIICSSVLEHIENPIIALSEMKRILKPGGKIFIYVPSIYPYHARKGHYPDYWRFFDDTLEMLFKNWSSFEIHKAGGYFKALFFFIPMQHKIRFILDPISSFLDRLFKTSKRTTASGYYVYAIK